MQLDRLDSQTRDGESEREKNDGGRPMTLDPTQKSAPHVNLEQADGQSLAIDRLWRDRTVVLVFLRHFG